MGKPETPLELQSQIVEMYLAGLNMYQVSKQAGVHDKTVGRILRKKGIEVRDVRTRGLTLEDRFWKMVCKGEFESSCWSWNGAKYKKGYGQISHLNSGIKRTVLAHRLSYKIHYGDFDQSLLVCHHCDNPECCNPLHLFLGTAQDNILDKHAKGRNPDINGEKNPVAKLTAEQVAEMRSQNMTGESVSSLAKLYGVSISHARRIISKQAWINNSPQ